MGWSSGLKTQASPSNPFRHQVIVGLWRSLTRSPRAPHWFSGMGRERPPMIEPVDPNGEVASGRMAGSPVPSFLVSPAQAFGRPVCRLGLAARGGAALTPDDVLYALDRGVNFLNWPGESDLPGGPDAVSQAVATLGPRRESVVVSVQFGARTAAEAADELRLILATLKTDSIDVLTFYYVEQAAEWHALAAPGGAFEYCRAAQRAGVIRRIGITSHQRPLAAEIARS